MCIFATSHMHFCFFSFLSCPTSSSIEHSMYNYHHVRYSIELVLNNQKTIHSIFLLCPPNTNPIYYIQLTSLCLIVSHKWPACGCFFPSAQLVGFLCVAPSQLSPLSRAQAGWSWYRFFMYTVVYTLILKIYTWPFPLKKVPKYIKCGNKFISLLTNSSSLL